MKALPAERTDMSRWPCLHRTRRPAPPSYDVRAGRTLARARQAAICTHIAQADAGVEHGRDVRLSKVRLQHVKHKPRRRFFKICGMSYSAGSVFIIPWRWSGFDPRSRRRLGASRLDDCR